MAAFFMSSSLQPLMFSYSHDLPSSPEIAYLTQYMPVGNA